MKRIGSLFLILVLSVTFVLGGCGKKDSKEAAKETAEPKTVTVKDSKGKSVAVPREPKKVVVMNNAVAEIIYVLGESDKIVGVSDSTKFPEDLKKKDKVGKAFTPDIEKVLALKPDLVFGYGDYVKKENIDKLNAAGVAFISIDGFKIETLSQDIRTLGTIFNKKDRAEEYVTFINKYLDMVKGKVEKISPDQRVAAYWEGYTENTSAAKGSAGNEMLTLAGLNNIAGSEPTAYPKVSNEWILQKNPKMVVKVAPSAVPFGYGVTDCKGISAERDKMMKRTGWANMNAAKDGNVYIISNDIATSARSVVGICYLAKWAYPDQFKDLNPEEVHKELLQKFYKVDYKGTWVCNK